MPYRFGRTRPAERFSDGPILAGGIFDIFGALAEFERELNRERTRAGLAAVRARGRKGRRPKKPDTPKKIAMAQSVYDEGKHSINDICQTLGVSRARLYRVIKTGDRP